MCATWAYRSTVKCIDVTFKGSVQANFNRLGKYDIELNDREKKTAGLMGDDFVRFDFTVCTCAHLSRTFAAFSDRPTGSIRILYTNFKFFETNQPDRLASCIVPNSFVAVPSAERHRTPTEKRGHRRRKEARRLLRRLLAVAPLFWKPRRPCFVDVWMVACFSAFLAYYYGSRITSPLTARSRPHKCWLPLVPP